MATSPTASRREDTDQPPIWLIDFDGRMKFTLLIWCPAHFVATARSMRAAMSSSVSPLRSGEQVELLRGEQAGPEFALGGQPHSVAVAAERLGDRGNDADPRPGAVGVAMEATVEIAEPVGGSGTTRRHHLDRMHGIDRRDDLVLTDDLVVQPVTGRVERHELDEADLDVVLAAVVRECDDLVVVDATFDDRIDLDRVESRFLGGSDPVQHVDEFVTPSHLMELLAIERVEADVHPPEPGLTEATGDETHRGAVRGHREVDRSARMLELGELVDEHRQMRSNGRLPARQTDALHAVALDEDPRQPLDLLERHHLGPWQPLHALLGHAVGASEVAAIGDRDAQVLDHAAERIDQILVRKVPGHLDTLLADLLGPGTDRIRRRRTATSAPAGRPSPSGITAMASADAVAAS